MELSRPRGRRIRWAGVLLVAVGCARPGLPPGGPADLTPPEVVAVLPESLAVGVPVDATIVVTFSEKVDPTTVEKAIWVTPAGLVKPKFDLSGATLTIRPGRALPESTTIGVLLTTVLRDNRRESRPNRLRRPYRWVFSTGEAIWPGILRGTAERVGSGAEDPGNLLIALYAGEGDTIPDPLVADPIAITEADSSGHYSLIGIPADGRLRWLFGLYDRDGNREIRGRGEFASARAESVLLTPEAPERDLPLRLIDPEAPGIIQGTLVRAEGDSTPVWVELFAAGAEADSTAPALRRAQAAPGGAFSLRNVAPGRYALAAFCDADSSGRREVGEAASAYGTVTLPPGETVELGEWTGPQCLP